MNAWDFLAQIDRAMTMMDVDLMEWQGHLDMAALACLDLTVYETEVQMELPLPLTVKRVPLKKGLNGPVIGVADVDLETGLMKAEIDDQYKELIGFPDAFSIRDEPPELDHSIIKAQLRELIDPELYRNPYNTRRDEMSAADLTFPEVNLKMMVAGKWTNIDEVPEGILDNHPFFIKGATGEEVAENFRVYNRDIAEKNRKLFEEEILDPKNKIQKTEEK